jgi:clathrin heavy chain
VCSSDLNLFKDLIAQVSNADILYRSLNFYFDYSPLELNDLLSVVGAKVDPARVITTFSRTNSLQLIKNWLAAIQSENVQAVNEALNGLYVEDGDYEALRHSVDAYDLFDAIGLARSLEKHECLEFRRISSYLYRKLKRWNEAIRLSKIDHLYGDCIETASQSRSSEVVEPLLRFFVDEKLFECFAAATFVCYDLVTADLILELAWRHQAIDFAMPYLIQSIREQNATIARISAQLEDVGGKVDETKQIAQAAASQSQAPAAFGGGAPFPGDGGFPGGPASFVAPVAAPFGGPASAPFPGQGGFGQFPDPNAAGFGSFTPAFPPQDGGFQPQFPPTNFGGGGF